MITTPDYIQDALKPFEQYEMHDARLTPGYPVNLQEGNSMCIEGTLQMLIYYKGKHSALVFHRVSNEEHQLNIYDRAKVAIYHSAKTHDWIRSERVEADVLSEIPDDELLTAF